MIREIFAHYYEYKRKVVIKSEKRTHIEKVHAVEFHKNLKKYRPRLEKIASELNHLFYDIEREDMSLERQFIILFVLKLRDLFESTLLLIGVCNYHSIFPLIRSLIESLYLLKYIKINPEYLNEFMKKEGKGERVSKIFKAVDDKLLKDLYITFSDVVHVNPLSYKLTLWKFSNTDLTMIAQSPRNEDEKYDMYTLTVINLMENSIKILHELESKIDTG